MLNDVEYEILALLPTGAAPLSIILPEVRQAVLPRVVSPAEFVEAAEALHDRGLLSLVADDPDDNDYRSATMEDRNEILADYEAGERDMNKVEQILDRVDLWLDITSAGRECLFSDPRSRTTP